MLTSQSLRLLGEEGDRRLRSRVKELKASTKKLVIYGTGEAGLAIHSILKDNGVEIYCFTDSDPSKWNGRINDIAVVSPESLINIKNVFVLIASCDSRAIIERINNVGISDYDWDLYLSILALPLREVYLKNIEKIKYVGKVLGDNLSRKVLFALVKHAFSLDSKLLSSICQPNQYFINNRFGIKKGDVIVDGGAYVGDTIAATLNSFGNKFGMIHSFEPNKESYAALNNYVRDQKLDKVVTTYNVGLADKNDCRCFSGNDSGFHLNSVKGNAGERIKLISVDEVFDDTRVDFIKMDLEGEELDALKGSKKVIKRDKPRLAVCAYHLPDHLWKVPLYILSLVPQYKLFMRHHTEGRYETVVYAVHII